MYAFTNGSSSDLSTVTYIRSSEKSWSGSTYFSSGLGGSLPRIEVEAPPFPLPALLFSPWFSMEQPMQRRCLSLLSSRRTFSASQLSCALSRLEHRSGQLLH